jgi:hypothetical protein
MKLAECICYLIVFLASSLGLSFAEDFLGVPIVPGAKVIKKVDNKRLEFVVNMSHDQVLRFYKEALKGVKDIRIREWKNSTYIEDDGNRKWHSIDISKVAGQNGVRVIIKKDSWTWILGTLLLRYVGVFVVLMILFVALSASNRIIYWMVSKMEKQKGGQK